jgi:hypothetical protein
VHAPAPEDESHRDISTFMNQIIGKLKNPAWIMRKLKICTQIIEYTVKFNQYRHRDWLVADISNYCDKFLPRVKMLTLQVLR